MPVTIIDTASRYIMELFPGIDAGEVHRAVMQFCEDHRVLPDNPREVVAHNVIATSIVFYAICTIAKHATEAGYQAGITPRGNLFLRLPRGITYELTHELTT